MGIFAEEFLLSQLTLPRYKTMNSGDSKMMARKKLQCCFIFLVIAGSPKWRSGVHAQAEIHQVSGEGRWDERFDALGLNGPVYAIALRGQEVYVGGYFANAGTISAHNIARWDGSNWHALGTGISNAGAPAFVYALATTSDGKLYAGGQFSQAGIAHASNIAVWDGVGWAALGAAGARGTNSTVYALAANGNEVFASGLFTIAGDLITNGMAKWNGVEWSRLGTTLTNGVTGGAAYALSIFVDLLFAGGDFANAGSVPAPTMARWNITTGSWSALQQGVNGKVQCLSGSFSGELVAGGVFSSASGVTANNIARWDGNAWSSLGTGSANGIIGEVRALTQNDGYLYAGGNFFEAGGQAASGIARWDRSSWSTLGEGVGGIVHALAGDSSGAVYAGGQFVSAGGKPAKNFGIWYEAPNAVQEKNVTSEIGNFELYSNYPNPFNPQTTIQYYLPAAQFVTLKIIDAKGREVATLVKGLEAAGEHRVRFNAEKLSAGVYFCRFTAGAFAQTRKMALAR